MIGSLSLGATLLALASDPKAPVPDLPVAPHRRYPKVKEEDFDRSPSLWELLDEPEMLFRERDLVGLARHFANRMPPEDVLAISFEESVLRSDLWKKQARFKIQVIWRASLHWPNCTAKSWAPLVSSPQDQKRKNFLAFASCLHRIFPYVDRMEWQKICKRILIREIQPILSKHPDIAKNLETSLAKKLGITGIHQMDEEGFRTALRMIRILKRRLQIP